MKNFTDNKKFWRTVKPLISHKGVQLSRITLVDKKEDKTEKKNKIGDSNNEIISDDLNVANTLNEYFENAIAKLEITEYSDNFGTNTAILGDPVDIALEKFKYHLSVKIIKENVSTESLFHFKEISVSDMTKELSSLNLKKAGTFRNIPTKMLRISSDIYNKVLQKIWNSEILREKCFLQNLKLADITPIFKKKDPTLAKSYRPVSVLLTVFKVLERIIQKQLLTHIECFLLLICVDIEKGLERNLLLFILLKSRESFLIIRDILGQF